MNYLIQYVLNNRILILFGVILLLLAGVWALTRAPIDAIPDIGENQIIVWAEWPGRSPQDMEDQVTYPLTTSLMGTPRVKRWGSSSSSRVEKEFECPLCGVAERKTRFSNSGAKCRTILVALESVA